LNTCWKRRFSTNPMARTGRPVRSSRRAPLAGALVLAATAVGRAAGYALPLYDADDDAYVGNVTLGSPPQPLSIQLDLMSADLWVPSNASGLGNPHHVFHRWESATYRYDGANLTLPYAPRLNASVLVEVSDDTLGLTPGSPSSAQAPLSVNVTFGLAVQLDAYFWAARFDGILGLGLDDSARVSRSTVLDRLSKTYGLSPLFSLFLARKGLSDDGFGLAAPHGVDAAAKAAAGPSPSSRPLASSGPDRTQSVLLLGEYGA
jgi:hypothetical protein